MPKFSQDYMQDIALFLCDKFDYDDPRITELKQLIVEFVQALAHDATQEGAGAGIYFIADACISKIKES